MQMKMKLRKYCINWRFVFEFLQYLRWDRIGIFNNRHMKSRDVMPQGLQWAQKRSCKITVTGYDRMQIQKNIIRVDFWKEEKKKYHQKHFIET